MIATENLPFSFADSGPLTGVEQPPVKPGTPDRKGQLTTWTAVHEFIFAGNARFTLRSLKTGMRYTYRIDVNKKDLKDPAKKDDPAYFVSLLRGADNERDYKYIGCMHGTKFFITSASRLPHTSPSVQGLLWFLDAMSNTRNVLGKTLEFWHDGRCACCGRVLTVPESVASGWGPECAKRRAG
jgi:hypothetical protein